MTTSTRTARARRLRREQTDAEARLWSIVRNRKLGGCKFRRQVPIDRYVADFACLDAKLIVELDGGQHAERQDQDAARTATLEAYGYRVLRFWNFQVLDRDSGVADTILHELTLTRRQSPLP